MPKKESLLLDASGAPASSRGIVVRSLKTYALVDLEVSTDAEGPLELLTNARDPFAATIVAVRMELDKRDEKIAELETKLETLSTRVRGLGGSLGAVGKVVDSILEKMGIVKP